MLLRFIVRVKNQEPGIKIAHIYTDYCPPYLGSWFLPLGSPFLLIVNNLKILFCF